MEIYVEDNRKDEKHVPDLLESIMRPTCLVKEALRAILFRIVQIMSKSKKSGFQLFGFRKSRRRPKASLLASKF